MLSRERKRFVLPKENSCVLLDWMIVPGQGQCEGEGEGEGQREGEGRGEGQREGEGEGESGGEGERERES